MTTIVALMSASLQGCSFLVDLAFFNNTDHDIELCNLNLAQKSCQHIPSRQLAKVLIDGDSSNSTKSWRFSIERLGHGSGQISTYHLRYNLYPAYASRIYCKTIFKKVCDIPVQYEASGLVYWAGTDAQLPIQQFPEQSAGFPLKPD